MSVRGSARSPSPARLRRDWSAPRGRDRAPPPPHGFDDGHDTLRSLWREKRYLRDQLAVADDEVDRKEAVIIRLLRQGTELKEQGADLELHVQTERGEKKALWEKVGKLGRRVKELERELDEAKAGQDEDDDCRIIKPLPYPLPDRDEDRDTAMAIERSLQDHVAAQASHIKVLEDREAEHVGRIADLELQVAAVRAEKNAKVARLREIIAVMDVKDGAGVEEVWEPEPEPNDEEVLEDAENWIQVDGNGEQA